MQATAQIQQLLLHLQKGGINKCNPSICFIFQFIQYVPIKNKDRQDIVFAFEGVVQSGIVLQAKVSPKPDNIDSIH